TRPAGSRFDRASHRRWLRADRLGCTHFASSNAPTVRSGSTRSPYGFPSIRACPLVGRSNPRIIRMVVDLPAPLGPRNPVTRPGSTVKVRSSTDSVDPYLLV